MKIAKLLLGLLVLVIAVFVTLKYEKTPALKTSRLLVNIQASTGFTPQEFAKATSATLVTVDPRNPFKSIQPIFSDQPFIVLSPELSDKSLAALAKRYGYRYMSISNPSIEEAVTQSKEYLLSIPKFSSEISYLNKENAQKIYALMQQVDGLLKNNHVPYWATCGTLLGAIRHGGLIPWDDDLDICILDQDEKKLMEMQLDELGLAIHHYWKDFYKIYKKDGAPIADSKKPGEILPFRYPFVDVFVVTLDRNKEHEDVYVHKSNNFYFVFNNERFTYAQIANLSHVPFGPMMIPIPANPEQFLNAAYGTSQYPSLWKKYAIEPTWVHQTEKSADIKGAAFVEINDYSPAQY
jgi:lipopolysaccharide cholinephosphotransferase